MFDQVLMLKAAHQFLLSLKLSYSVKVHCCHPVSSPGKYLLHTPQCVIMNADLKEAVLPPTNTSLSLQFSAASLAFCLACSSPSAVATTLWWCLTTTLQPCHSSSWWCLRLSVFLGCTELIGEVPFIITNLFWQITLWILEIIFTMCSLCPPPWKIPQRHWKNARLASQHHLQVSVEVHLPARYAWAAGGHHYPHVPVTSPVYGVERGKGRRIFIKVQCCSVFTALAVCLRSLDDSIRLVATDFQSRSCLIRLHWHHFWWGFCFFYF